MADTAQQPQSYTEDEKNTMRTGAFGAVMLVSRAEPGMMDSIKESFAASRALSRAPGEMQDVFKGMPKMPKGDRRQLEAGILADLTSSVAAISAKNPAQLDAFRQAVVDACTRAADAAGGISPAEVAALMKVKSAMGIGPQPA